MTTDIARNDKIAAHCRPVQPHSDVDMALVEADITVSAHSAH